MRVRGARLLVVVVALSAGCTGHRARAAPPQTTTTGPSTDLVPLSSDGVRLRGTMRRGLPAGTPGQVEVVSRAPRPTSRSVLPVVVRNNTAGPVTGVVVAATVTDPAGATVASGRSEALAPWYVEGGQLSIGYVALSGPVPDDVTFAFTTESHPAGDSRAETLQDLFVVRAVPRGNELSGRVQNLIGTGIYQTFVTYVCFDRDAVPIDAGRLATDPDSMPAGYPADFRSALIAGCDSVLVGAYGETRAN